MSRLARLIETLDAEPDADRALLDRLLARADSKELAAAIEFCAIPRRFDAEIIGALRARPDDHEGNERLLGQVLEYSFVRSRQSGGWAYHDSVRDVLFEKWRSEERRAELEEFILRLTGFYKGLYERSQRAQQDAVRVHRIVQRASPARYGQLAATIEAGLVDPLVEATYQLSSLSVTRAFQFLEEHVYLLEDQGRSVACLRLLAAGRDIVAAREDDPDQASVMDWLKYWNARVLMMLDRPAEAEEQLLPLADPEGADTRLRFWALSGLGLAQRLQFKLADARATSEEQIRVGTESQIDPDNVPNSYLHLGEVYLRLEQPAEAARLFREGAEAARQLDDPHRVMASLTALADAEIKCGRRYEGVQIAIEALDIGRMQVRELRQPQADLAGLLVEAVAHEGPDLADTLHAEGEALLAGLSDPLALIRGRIDRISALRGCGRRSDARRELEALGKAIAAVQSDLVEAAFGVEAGKLDLLDGHYEAAIEHFTTADAASAKAGRHDLGAIATDYRADALAALGREAEADAALADCARRFAAQGSQLRAALAEAKRAATAHGTGHAAEADRLLDEVEREAAGGAARLLADIAEVRARHEARQGHWTSAGAAWERFAERSRQAAALDDLARAEAELASVAAARGRWGAAEQHASRAARHWAALRDRDGTVPSRSRVAADEQNAEGVRSLLTGDDPAAPTAREHFQAAIAKQPDAWYRLNASYADAAVGDWGSAVESLTTAMAAAPWLRCPALEARLGEHHVARDQGLLDDGEPKEAAGAFADTIERLGGAQGPLLRGRCTLGLAESLLALGDVAGAEASYRSAEADGFAAATLRLGQLHEAAGRRDEALDAYHRGAGADDPAAAVDCALHALDLLGDDDAAELTEMIATLQRGNNPRWVLELGDRLLSRDDIAAAADVYAAAEPALPEAAIRLGNLEQNRGDPAAARSAFERALRAQDSTVRGAAAGRLGDLLADEGDVAGATTALRMAVAEFGVAGDPWAALRLGQLLADGGDTIEAERLLRQVARAGDLDAAPRALLALGGLMAEADRVAAARDAYWRAIEYSNLEVAATAALQLLDPALADGDAAANREAVIVHVLQGGARAALLLGEQLAERGDHEAALDLLRRAADMDGDLYAPDAMLLLGDVLKGTEALDEARAAYRGALASGDATVVPEAAFRLIDDPDASSEDATREVLSLGGYAAYRFASMLVDRGDRAGAITALRLVAGTPDELYAPDAALALGQLLAASGDGVGARRAYEQARDSSDSWAASLAEGELAALENGSATASEETRNGGTV